MGAQGRVEPRMTAGWGHWPNDTHRHVIQQHRGDASKARRRCRPKDVHDPARIPQGSGHSDLPPCALCDTRGGRGEAGRVPVTRPGWVAGRDSVNQTRLVP